MSRARPHALDRLVSALAAKISPHIKAELGPLLITELSKFKNQIHDEVSGRLNETAVRPQNSSAQSANPGESQVPNHQAIRWFHSIDLGNGMASQGVKSAELLAKEFGNLHLSADLLSGKRLLDIGCNDGFFSFKCEALGADVTAIDGIYNDGLRFARQVLRPKFRFYTLDLMSTSFYELGHFDVILYLGVLYHSMFPYEQLLRIANACAPNALFFLETEYYNLPGLENDPTIYFDYNQKLSIDATSPVYPSIVWLEQTLQRLGFRDQTVLDRFSPGDGRRGRITLRARYFGESGGRTPFLYAAEQV